MAQVLNTFFGGGVILIEVFNSIKFVTTVVCYMHFVIHYLFKVG